MATAAVQCGEHFNELLQCSVCVDVFTDPRTLPCLHTFCCKCIGDWCKDTLPGGIVTCPECRREFFVPDIGVDGLKKNVFISNLLSINEVKQKIEELCEVCVGDDKKISEMFCLQCEQSYCESCSQSHSKIKHCKFHKIVPLDELQSGVDINKKYLPQYCDKHTDKLIELYCLNDDVAICMMCCVLDHRSHRCEEIMKIANQFRSGKWKQDFETTLSRVVEKLEVLNAIKLRFFDHIQSVENEICEEADKKIQLIKSHQQKLISSLQNIKTHHEQEIDKVNQELTQAKSLLLRFKGYCDGLLKEGSDVDLCREKNSVCKRADELMNIKDVEDALGKLGVTNVIFSSSSATFEDAKNVVGELEAACAHEFGGVFSELKHKSMSPVTPTVTACANKSGRVFSESKHKSMSPVTPTVTDNPQLWFMINDVPEDSNGRTRQVKGVAVLKNCCYAIYDKYNTVEVFAKVININEMNGPCDMVCCSVTSQLFISEWDSDVIWRVDINSGKRSVFIKHGYRYTYLSLAENRLLVTSPDLLLIYDIVSGERIKTVPLEGVMKKNVYYAIESNRNSFFVCHGLSNGGLRTVSEINSEGRVIRVLDNKKGQLNCGRMALDSAGRLLVAEYKSKSVVLLDEKLRYGKILIDKKALNNTIPCRLSYNKNDNRLVVGLNNGHVKIFDFNAY